MPRLHFHVNQFRQNHVRRLRDMELHGFGYIVVVTGSTDKYGMQWLLRGVSGNRPVL